MSNDLRRLVTRCMANDQVAFRALVDRYRGRVFTLCYRMLGQWQDAEDAMQETFVRVVRHLARWDSQREFEPWLLTIAANRCRSLRARRSRRPAAQPLIELIPDPRVEQGAQARRMAEEVSLALQNLRPEYRQAFILFHHQGLSYAQIAKRLDCPLGTVKTWVYRARREMMMQFDRRAVLQESSDEV